MDALQKTEFENTAENEAAEEAAFDAVVNGADPEPATPPSEDTATRTAEETSAATEPVIPEGVLTRDEITALLEKTRLDTQTEMQKIHDKVFGKVGELKQRIDSFKSAGGLSPKAKERLTSDFPELASMLFDEDGNEPEPVQHHNTGAAIISDPRVDELSKTFETKLLTRDHRDWQQVVQSPEFVDWKEKVLTPADAAELDNSWDADYISGKISEFKSYREQHAKKTETDKQKQERLAAAVTPRGVPRYGRTSTGDDDEESAMMAAYGRKN